MIVSHKYKYIFLKTNKTAGTSVEIALSKYCGSDDVIAPISEVDEQKRRDLGYPARQNYYLPLSTYSLRDLAKRVVKGKRKYLYNHISASEAKRYLGDTIWNSYYKFCFERNPWDRVISHYYWRCKEEPRPTISEFLDSPTAQLLKKRGWGVYTIDNKLAVDRVCRFEDLAGELESVRQHLGIPEPLEMPRTKTGTRKDRRSYQEVLSDAERQKIAEMFKDEIALMRYTF